MSKTRDQINEFLGKIDVTDKTVLDVGAGPKRAWLIPPEGEYTGSDRAKPKVSGVPAGYVTCDYDEQFDCDFHIDLNKSYPAEWFVLNGINNGPCDYVFCMETLEHVWNPVQAIETLSKLTKEKLFLSVPFIYPLHDTHDYLRYTFQWFEKVLPRFGFKTVQVGRRTSEDAHAFYQKEGMRMSKVTLKQGYADHIRDIGYVCEATK